MWLLVPRNPTLGGEGDPLYNSGLRRIRQQASGPQGFMIPSRSPSTASTRVNSLSLPASASTFGSCEDLARFPSESLHSFSFANQSEDLIHNRQNILKRSIEFMRDKLGWGTRSPLIATAQARVNGNEEEVESMMELLRKADIVSREKTPMLAGPATGPAEVDVNPFEQSFGKPKPPPVDTTRPFTDVDVFSASPVEEDGPSEFNSRSATDDSTSTARTTPPLVKRRPDLNRTYTDTSALALESKLYEAMAQPYMATESQPLSAIGHGSNHNMRKSSVHGHTANRYQPPAQAIFTTEAQSPWTILAANDLACLVFGVTMAEIRKIGIMEFVRPERREWLAAKLNSGENTSTSFPYPHSTHGSPRGTQVMYQGNRRAKSDAFYTGSPLPNGGSDKHRNTGSRGVILCGDVVPIQKRNGNTGAASLWVKEKRGGLIWVLEEINEDVAFIHTSQRAGDNVEYVTRSEGSLKNIFGEAELAAPGVALTALLPTLPRKDDGNVDFEQTAQIHQFTAACANGVRIPCGVEPLPGQRGLRVSSFPHIAGIMVLSASTHRIASTNAVFSAALFGHLNPVGLSISELIPNFDRMLDYLVNEEQISLVDGIVVPEHSFRKANSILSLRDNKEGAMSAFSIPGGVMAKHRDGSDIHVDLQMRVVISECRDDNAIVDESDTDDTADDNNLSETVYALWVTYSRHLHVAATTTDPLSAELNRPITPPRGPSPGQQSAVPVLPTPGGPETPPLTHQLEAIQQSPTPPSSEDELQPSPEKPQKSRPTTPNSVRMARNKKTIQDFQILEDMGQGAYGQVKLARYKRKDMKRVVLKYVTKRRILVDTWTRDRRLGTVPLEIHVLDYLGRDGLKHPNIVEMTDFFEDDINYYIEMVPHGLPGMDLFDYIELKVNMEEDECRSIFIQVARALYHLHIKAGVVHRDIKDENVVLDGAGNIKLIDFGSSAYIKNGPFDVFVGTIGTPSPFPFRSYIRADTRKRLCRPRSPPGKLVQGQRTGCVGARRAAVHHLLQGKSLLQRNPPSPLSSSSPRANLTSIGR
jgi:protein-serine/threonine kinase